MKEIFDAIEHTILRLILLILLILGGVKIVSHEWRDFRGTIESQSHSVPHEVRDSPFPTVQLL